MPKTKIKYPGGCDDNNKKYCFAYRVQELLRLEHNEMGNLYKTGQITEQEWKNYLKEFESKSYIVTQEVLFYRNIAKNNNNWDPATLEDCFE